MTTDPRQMTPDELNREAASGVMGWVVIPQCDLDSHLDNEDSSYPVYVDNEVLRTRYGSWVRWSPATDIADAWELVEKINGKDSRNISISHSSCSDKWTVMFLAYRKRGTSTFVVDRDASAEADTAPRAITIAAILVKRELTK